MYKWLVVKMAIKFNIQQLSIWARADPSKLNEERKLPPIPAKIPLSFPKFPQWANSFGLEGRGQNL
jgi:hypothetical protein